MSPVPDAGTLVELVRLPAVLSVPGDVLAGAAWSGGEDDGPARLAALVGSSALLYLAGMALNDYADRDIDALERPSRPIPSGRVTPDFALRLAAGLSAGGLALATLARRPPKATLVLTAVVWTYDLKTKGTKLGAPTMAAARALDVLAGAPADRPRAALPFALVMGLHTLMVTNVSASEVGGGSPELAKAAMAQTVLVSAATAGMGLNRAARAGSPRDALLSAVATVGLVALHAKTVTAAEKAAEDLPSARNFGRVVGAGILGMVPLQAAVLAGTGRRRTALGVAALFPLAKSLSRRRAVT